MITNPRLLVNCIMRENDLPLTQNSGQRKAPLPRNGRVEPEERETPESEAPTNGRAECPPIVAIGALFAGCGIFSPQHELECIFILRRSIKIGAEVKRVYAVHPLRGKSLGADVAVGCELTGGMSRHARVAKDKIYMRRQGKHGLELNADVIGTLARFLFKSGYQIGKEVEATMLELVTEGDGILETETEVIGAGVMLIVISVIKIVQILG